MLNLKLRGKLLFVIIPLILIFGISILFTLNFMIEKLLIDEKLDKDINLAYQLIDEEYIGNWNIKDEKLYKGRTLISENYYIVDKIKGLTDSVVTIFMNDTRVTTNVIKEDGKRAIGTKVSDEVNKIVLKDGKEYEGLVELFSKGYVAKYIPIKDSDNSIIGMFFMGIDGMSVGESVKPFIKQMMLITAIIVAISILVITLFVNKISKNINSVVTAVKKVEKGDLTSFVENNKLVKCWQAKNCDKKECIAYENDNLRCWQLSGTLCNGEIQGDITSKISYCEKCKVYEKVSGDEVMQITMSFNNMLATFRNTVNNIVQVSEHVASSSQQLAAASEESGASANEVSRIIEDIACGTEKQSGLVENMNDSVQNLVNKLHEVNNNTKNMSTISDIVTKSANVGKEAVNNAIYQMDKINESAYETKTVIGELDISSKEISKIIEVISNISEQTNMLALNAAIEAARAGEHGRGFAVVAEEVRNLAEETKKSTTDISNLINKISSGVNKVVVSMDGNSSEINIGKETILKTEATFNEIMDSINEVTLNIKQVRDSLDTVDHDGEKVREATLNINDIIHTAATSTQQVSCSAQEQSASSEEIAASADELSTIATKLLSNMKIFKV